MPSPLRKLAIPTVRLACLAALLVLAYACDARNPAAPAPATAPRRLDGAADGGDAQLGSLDLAPETPFSVVAEIPESKWALVRVNGAWSVKPNPACANQAPNWPCSTSPAYSGFAPGYPDAFAGPVRVATFHDGSWDELPMRAFGGAEDGVGLTQREFARTLFAGPVIRNPTVQEFGNTGPSIEAYILEGSFSVTVTAIQSPLRVTEGAPEEDGNRTYTVEPLYGLQLINPLGSSSPPGAIRWYFVPGDSISAVATNSDPPWSLPACADQPTCRWQPPVPGRVQVTAYVETRRARARSEGAPQCQRIPGPLGSRSLRYSVSGDACEQEPKLVLRCDGRTDTDSVLRGNRIKCTAAAEPSGSVTGLRWEFRDEQGHTITGPEGDAEWGGIMVVGGQMNVSGMVNGQTRSATLAVTVTPRDWTGKITFPPEPEPEWTSGPPLTYPPIIEGDSLADGTLGQSSWPGPEAASGYGEGTGPNEGWFFFDQPPYFSSTQSHIYINNALKPTDPFWRAQRGPPPSQVVMGKPACNADFMRRAARHILAHEHGHYSQAEALAKSAEGAALLESAVHWGDPVSVEEEKELFANYLRADRAQVARWDKESVLHVSCEFTRP